MMTRTAEANNLRTDATVAKLPFVPLAEIEIDFAKMKCMTMEKCVKQKK